MGRKDDKKDRRKESVHSFWEMPPSDAEREKQRARELRNSAWWRQKVSRGVCAYCGKSFKPDELTMDHIIPLSRGGRSEKINIVPCCKECNNQKRYLLPAEWDKYLERIRNDGSVDTTLMQ
jgi:5-methylcytosine-specific restriction enzyme A